MLEGIPTKRPRLLGREKQTPKIGTQGRRKEDAEKNRRTEAHNINCRKSTRTWYSQTILFKIVIIDKFRHHAHFCNNLHTSSLKASNFPPRFLLSGVSPPFALRSLPPPLAFSLPPPSFPLGSYRRENSAKGGATVKTRAIKGDQRRINGGSRSGAGHEKNQK